MNNSIQRSQLSISNIFSTARIYALISIICVHIYFANGIVSTLFNKVGSIGVITFLIMSGYFYRTNKFGSFKSMLKKKFNTVVIPWIVLGTLVWLYNFIQTKNTQNLLLGYINWIIGNSSYLYYLTVLFVCFLIFYKHNKTTLIIAIILNVLSIIMTEMGLLSNVLLVIRVSNYLNLFNWIGFFAFGILLQDVNEEQIIAFLQKTRFIFIILFNLILTTLIIFPSVNVHYFTILAILFEILGTLAIMGLSTFDLSKIKIFRVVSNYSFTIYLMHMVIIGTLDGLLAKYVILTLLSPLLIIVICYIVLWLVLFVSKKIKLEKLACLFLGVRNR